MAPSDWLNLSSFEGEFFQQRHGCRKSTVRTDLFASHDLFTQPFSQRTTSLSLILPNQKIHRSWTLGFADQQHEWKIPVSVSVEKSAKKGQHQTFFETWEVFFVVGWFFSHSQHIFKNMRKSKLDSMTPQRSRI